MTIDSVGIVGGGAWGTALGLVAARAGRKTLVYARDPATVAAINDNRASRCRHRATPATSPSAGR